MTDQEYIKELELRLEHAAEQQRAMQTSLAAILSEREREKADFDSRETMLRDQFASTALNGILASWDITIESPESLSCSPSIRKEIAIAAYRYSDAMMAARKPLAE